jgi:SNF2 family DNA or RNA helicase
VIVVSLQNLDWLLKHKHGADGIIIDELSKGAGKQTAGLKSKKKAGMLGWRVGMTATPVSQNFEKLFNMCRVLSPHYLGANKQKYLEQYFYSDYQGYNWTLRDGADAQIMAQVAPLVHLVEDTKANDLPALHQHVIRFEMPAETRVIYNQMKKDMVTDDREAANEAVKSGVLRQISSGFVYLEDDNVVTYDWARYDAACQWMKRLQGRPGVIFYEFKAQGRILNDLSCFTDDIKYFTSGDKDLLAAQINSLSHGVDGLQDVCSDILFYHPMWSRDATEQAIGRVWRTGQTKEVNVTTLVCDDTLDDLVMQRVEDRGEWMKLFKKHLEN